MPFTPEFENDIFISYCHYDNAAPNGELGWVDYFHEGLKSWLKRRFGHEKISIWRDKELQGCTLFDDRIQEQIRKSALFLALISPNYLKSDYCRQELEWFHNEAKKSPCGLSVNNECRIFNVLLKNIHYTDWPNQLEGTCGFPMHDQGEGSGNLGEFLDHRMIQYSEKLRKIVDAVEKTLNFFPSAGIGEKNPKEEENSKKEELRIFIADTADTLQNIREKLMDDLKREGVRIITKIPPPWDDQGHKTAVKKAIDDAHLAIHLLDGWPGRKIEDLKSLTFPRSQVETGLRSQTRQLIWVPKDLAYEAIEDKEYANFLESLERGAREKKEFEFIRDERINLQRLVLQTMNEIQAQRDMTGVDKNAPILLDTHQKDQRFALLLALYLNSKGFNVGFTQEYDDPASGLHNFEEALKHAHSLIIIYGSVAPNWIQQRLKKTIQLVYSQLIDRNKTSLENRWLCLLPSSRLTPEIETLTKEFRINFLDNRHSESPDENILKPLLINKNERETE